MTTGETVARAGRLCYNIGQQVNSEATVCNQHAVASEFLRVRGAKNL